MIYYSYKSNDFAQSPVFFNIRKIHKWLKLIPFGVKENDIKREFRVF